MGAALAVGVGVGVPIALEALGICATSIKPPAAVDPACRVTGIPARTARPAKT